jgi:hypothetical protein
MLAKSTKLVTLVIQSRSFARSRASKLAGVGYAPDSDPINEWQDDHRICWKRKTIQGDIPEPRSKSLL